MSRFIDRPDYYTVEPFSDDPIVTGGLVRTKKLNVFYVDVNSGYKQNLKGLVIYDDDVVSQQVANIFATPLGSDPFEPTFGSNVPYRLFEPINDMTAFLLYADCISALIQWMQKPGRILVNTASSFVRPINNDPDTEGYEVKMVYSIVQAKALSFFHGFIIK